MTKVTLLGDSIRWGYGKHFPQILGENFEVFQPDDNGRWAKYTLMMLHDYKDNISGSRIVHWNNGHWDRCKPLGDGFFTSPENYLEDICRVADQLLSRCDKVIFATTTPVKGENRESENEDIRLFNSLVVPALTAKGVIINDLYSLVYENLDKYICEDNLHLSAEGELACAKQVAKMICEQAELLK